MVNACIAEFGPHERMARRNARPDASSRGPRLASDRREKPPSALIGEHNRDHEGVGQ
jgi:hypothetical protein